ncbi:MAG: universal stress protein [Psychroflexus sp.]|nr:universal stress protein [Psychroflexus sp.]MDN6310328.1 universal stress protein [Psychroflexus sp.]
MNVLVLTDFSSTSTHILKYAGTLLHDRDVNFTLLHVQLPCSAFDCRGECKELINPKFDKNIETITPYLDEKHNIEPLFVEGQYIDSIRETVDSHNIDLIILGNSHTRQPSNASELDMKTFDIITKIKCHVLLVSGHSEIKLPKNFVLPTDFSISVDHKLFSIIRDLYAVEQNKLSILSLREVDKISDMQLLTQQRINRIVSNLNMQNINADFTQIESKKAFDSCIVFARNLSIFNRIFSSSPNTVQKICNKHLPILFLHG